MSIVKHCQAIWLYTIGKLKSLGKALKGLIRQSINQIHIDTLDTIFSSKIYGIFAYIIRLYSMYLLLHLWIKILHAKTDTIEAMLGKYFHLIFIEVSWIYLYAYFSIGCPIGKFLLDIRYDLIKLKIFVISRCPAAKVKLYHFTSGIKVL